MLKSNIYFQISFSLQYFQEKRPISISMHKPETCEILKPVKDDEALVMDKWFAHVRWKEP